MIQWIVLEGVCKENCGKKEFATSENRLKVCNFELITNNGECLNQLKENEA